MHAFNLNSIDSLKWKLSIHCHVAYDILIQPMFKQLLS